MYRIHTRWRRNYLTIDMFKFTDVTASHVYCVGLSVKLQSLSLPFTFKIINPTSDVHHYHRIKCLVQLKNIATDCQCTPPSDIDEVHTGDAVDLLQCITMHLLPVVTALVSLSAACCCSTCRCINHLSCHVILFVIMCFEVCSLR